MAADDQLGLIFMCCHPAFDPAVRIALTLRSVCGLTTAQIAAAFLAPEPTIAQRLVRAKRKIRQAGISLRVPPQDELAERLGPVLRVVYLVFTEGHMATSGDALVDRQRVERFVRSRIRQCIRLAHRRGRQGLSHHYRDGAAHAA